MVLTYELCAATQGIEIGPECLHLRTECGQFVSVLDHLQRIVRLCTALSRSDLARWVWVGGTVHTGESRRTAHRNNYLAGFLAKRP